MIGMALGVVALSGFSLWGEPRLEKFHLDVYRTMSKRSNDWYYEADDGTQKHEEFFGGTSINYQTCLACGKWRVVWSNRIHAESSRSQYRSVAWEWDLAIDIVPNQLSIFHRHHSQHFMDRRMDGFPLEDYVGIRINFLK